jgi:hypothetical protein
MSPLLGTNQNIPNIPLIPSVLTVPAQMAQEALLFSV